MTWEFERMAALEALVCPHAEDRKGCQCFKCGMAALAAAKAEGAREARYEDADWWHELAVDESVEGAERKSALEFEAWLRARALVMQEVPR